MSGGHSDEVRARCLQQAVDDVLDRIEAARAALAALPLDAEERTYQRTVFDLASEASYALGRLGSFRSAT